MSEFLLGFLQTAFREHGLECDVRGERIHGPDGLTIVPRVFPRDDVRGLSQVQVDFAVESPRLAAVPLLDSFAGVGNSPDEAQANAAGKFLQGSFDVIAAALTRRDADAGEIEWADWVVGERGWKVCAGPVLMVASREGARIEGVEEFLQRLNALLGQTLAPGPHWMRVFLGALEGKHMGGEVLVDGAVWADGQKMLDAHAWVYPEGYASFRHLLIALPREV